MSQLITENIDKYIEGFVFNFKTKNSGINYENQRGKRHFCYKKFS